MQKLKLYRETPDNGLVIFCGALMTNGPGSEVIVLREIVPPKPVKSFLYQCDDHFHIEYLKDMLREEKVYGILAIDANDVGIGILSGRVFEIVNVMTSGISGKTRKGGQSARRYERGREMELTYFYHRVADHANRIFVEEYKVTGIIVGGPGFTKEDFLKTEFLNYHLRKNIIAIIDTAYSGREGVRELVDKAADKLQDVRLFEEKKLVQRFLGEVNKPNGVAVYGLPRIIQALDKSNIETILVADDVDMMRITATCKNCQTVKEKYRPELEEDSGDSGDNRRALRQLRLEGVRGRRERHRGPPRGEGHPGGREGRGDILGDRGGGDAKVLRRGRCVREIQDDCSVRREKRPHRRFPAEYP